MKNCKGETNSPSDFAISTSELYVCNSLIDSIEVAEGLESTPVSQLKPQPLQTLLWQRAVIKADNNHSLY